MGGRGGANYIVVEIKMGRAGAPAGLLYRAPGTPARRPCTKLPPPTEEFRHRVSVGGYAVSVFYVCRRPCIVDQQIANRDYIL